MFYFRKVELWGYAEEAKMVGRDVIEVEVNGEKGFISVREVEEAWEDIVNQVVARDYKLIEQSDVIIVYYPTTTLSKRDKLWLYPQQGRLHDIPAREHKPILRIPHDENIQRC